MLRFDSILPIVASGAFHPEFDLQGNPLQRLGRDGANLEHITLNVTVFEGQTVMALGWIGNDDGPAKTFANSFARVADNRKADVLVRLLFAQTDNLFLRPSWWEALPLAQQTVFKKMVLSGSTTQVRSAVQFVDDGSSAVAAVALETVSD